MRVAADNVPAMTAEARAANDLEAEAREYPDQRGEILLEAAGQWSRAGEPDRAIALPRQVIDEPGENAAFARVDLAELLFGLGRDAEAREQLSALARDPALHEGHCEVAAELLAGRGELTEALAWYDRLVARLGSEEIDAVRSSEGPPVYAAVSLRGRRHVREELGLPPDAMDEIVPVSPLEAAGSPENLAARFGTGQAPPNEIRILSFRRADRAEATRRWPDMFEESDAEYYPAAERRRRELADSGVPAIRLVTPAIADLEAFATDAGGSVTDTEIRTRYAELAPPEKTVAWPPGRNAPCWCGSGGKYKKCCGRAGA
ncbi:SEC-C domain-containing protein [Pseudonocardia zijingensis]|uniref:SEC-C domain-containing protein n=2 Tax=Pseudonocardia zijingensis TaxID=153376 RepID=A0ABN1PFK8_9PSEU